MKNIVRILLLLSLLVGVPTLFYGQNDFKVTYERGQSTSFIEDRLKIFLQ